jgi:hypothetical protein
MLSGDTATIGSTTGAPPRFAVASNGAILWTDPRWGAPSTAVTVAAERPLVIAPGGYAAPLSGSRSHCYSGVHVRSATGARKCCRP